MAQEPTERPHKILVVDDDLGILEALELMLLDAGYEVDTSSKNGKLVREKLKKGLPDLIILDVLLSGHDGRDICRALKSQEHTKDIPIIMISAHPTAREGSLEAGADEFLAKPFDIDELLDKIEGYLG